MVPSIVITGANRGLGLELSIECQKKGIPFYMTARTAAKVDIAVKEKRLTPLGTFELDLESDQAIDQIDVIMKGVKNVSAFIHNASPFSTKTLAEATDRELFTIGRFATANLVLAKRVMASLSTTEMGGRLIFIGAIIGQPGRAWKVPFSFYKASLRGLVEAINKEEKGGKKISATHFNLGSIRESAFVGKSPFEAISFGQTAKTILTVATLDPSIVVEHLDLFALHDVSKY